jgi:bla regulator protein BlaR1
MRLDLIGPLGETTLATSAAIALVLWLRRPMRAVFGSGAAYGLWMLVPITLLAVLLPAPTRPVLLMPMAVKIGAGQAVSATPMASAVPWTWVLISAWLVGGMTVAALQLWQQRRFLRRLGPLRVHAHGLRVAATNAGLPAVTGVLRPRIVLPADFLSRYDADERALIVAHERQHIARGDLPCNALVAVLRCVYWFNPLLHWAVARYRHDQELACDARVIARHPHARRPYAQAMLKTQLDHVALPVGCHWHTHPIKERITMLKRPSPRRWQTGLSSTLLLALFCSGGYAAWAQQPASAPDAQASGIPSVDQYDAALQLAVDNERHSFQMHSAAHAPFSFSVDTQSDQHWEGTLTVAPFARGRSRSTWRSNVMAWKSAVP